MIMMMNAVVCAANLLKISTHTTCNAYMHHLLFLTMKCEQHLCFVYLFVYATTKREEGGAYKRPSFIDWNWFQVAIQ